MPKYPGIEVICEAGSEWCEGTTKYCCNSNGSDFDTCGTCAVAKKATKFTDCKMDYGTININTSNRLTARLVTVDGVGVPNRKVVVTLAAPSYENGYVAPAVYTDAYGYLVVVVPASWHSEVTSYYVKFAVEIRFPGDSSYLESPECWQSYDVTGCSNPSGVDASKCIGNSTCTLKENYCEGGRTFTCMERKDCVKCYVDTGPCGDCTPGLTRPAVSCAGAGGIETCQTVNGKNTWVLTTPCPVIKFTTVTCVLSKPTLFTKEAQTLTGLLKDHNGVAMANYLLRIAVTDPTGITVNYDRKTAANGTYSLALTPTMYGQYVVSVDFDGLLGTIEYKPCFCNSTFNVKCVEGDALDPTNCPNGTTIYGRVCKGGTYIGTGQTCPTTQKISTKFMDCKIDFGTIDLNESNVFRGRLVSDDGLLAPIGGAEIKVILNAPSYENSYTAPSVYTDGQGYFTVIIPASWHTEVTSVYVKFGVEVNYFGDATHLNAPTCHSTYDVVGCSNPSGVDPVKCYGIGTCNLKENYCEGGRSLVCMERTDCQKCYVDMGLCGECTPGLTRPAISCAGEGGIETCKVVNGKNTWVLTTACPIIKFTNLSCVANKPTILPNDIETISGFLKTQDAIAIANAWLKITVTDPSGNFVAHDAQTAKDGSYAISFAPSVIYGLWTVGIHFAGTTGATSYIESFCNKTFTVQCVNGERLDPQMCEDGTTIYGQECVNGVFTLTNQQCPTCHEGDLYDPFTCQDGEQIYLSKCVGNQLVDSGQVCFQGCSPEGQTAEQEICSDGSRIYHKKCQGGEWVDSGQVCPTCQANAKECRSGVPYQCQNGAWVQGGDACDQCQSGQTKCENNLSYQCQNGQWAQGGNACQGDQCEVGDTKCQNGYWWNCQNGYWKMSANPCDDGNGGGGGIFGNIDPKMLLILGGAGVAAILGVAMITRRP